MYADHMLRVGIESLVSCGAYATLRGVSFPKTCFNVSHIELGTQSRVWWRQSVVLNADLSIREACALYEFEIPHDQVIG
jgi:hypothetical protein